MMFRVRMFYLRADKKDRMEEVACIAGVKPRTVFDPLFYESSEAHKRIKKAGLIDLFTVL